MKGRLVQKKQSEQSRGFWLDWEIHLDWTMKGRLLKKKVVLTQGQSFVRVVFCEGGLSSGVPLYLLTPVLNSRILFVHFCAQYTHLQISCLKTERKKRSLFHLVTVHTNQAHKIWGRKLACLNIFSKLCQFCSVKNEKQSWKSDLITTELVCTTIISSTNVHSHNILPIIHSTQTHTDTPPPFQTNKQCRYL